MREARNRKVEASNAIVAKNNAIIVANNAMLAKKRARQTGKNKKSMICFFVPWDGGYEGSQHQLLLSHRACGY